MRNNFGLKILPGDIHNPQFRFTAASGKTGSRPVIIHPEKNQAAFKVKQRGHFLCERVSLRVVSFELNPGVLAFFHDLKDFRRVHDTPLLLSVGDNQKISVCPPKYFIKYENAFEDKLSGSAGRNAVFQRKNKPQIRKNPWQLNITLEELRVGIENFQAPQ